VSIVIPSVARPCVVGLTALLLSGCLSVSTSSTGGDATRDGQGFVARRDERVRIGAFTRIDAVAVSRRFLYAASGGGIAVYDRWQERWMPPLTRDAGFLESQLSVLAGDPIEDALWIGVPGGVVIYRPDTEQLQRTAVVGIPDVIAFDRSGTGDALVRSGGTWTRVSRIGMATPSGPPSAATLVIPPTLETLMRQYPQLRTANAAWLQRPLPNRPLPRLAVVSGAAAPERASEVWLGTDRFGLYRVDPVSFTSRHVPYGLREPGVGALAPALDGVWAAGLGLIEGDAEGGVTFTTSDLQRWRWIDGTIARPLTGRAVAMASRANRLWIAYVGALVRVFTDGAQDVKGWSTLDGLADARTLAVAPAGDGAYVATMRGVQFVSDSIPEGVRNRRDAVADERAPSRPRAVGPVLLPDVPVEALQLIGDTLWAGTPAGLIGIAGPRQSATRIRPSLPSRRPVRALAWSDTALIAATGDGIFQMHPRRDVPAVRLDALSTTSVGAVTRVAIDPRAIAVAGTDGVLVQSRRTGALRLLSASQLPGPVLDIVAQGGWWWLGTPQGLVRLARDGDGLPR